MQVQYGQQPQWVNGQVADGSSCDIDSLTNELLAQITTATYAGVTDNAGDYSLQIDGPDGEQVLVTHTSPGSETSAQIATAIAALLNAEADFANMATVADDAAGELTLTFLHEGRVYAVSGVVAAGTLVIADTQDAGGTALQLGVAVQGGSADNLVAAVDGSTVDDDVVGLTVRSIDALVNDLEGATAVGTPNQYQPGKTVAVGRRGVFAILVEDAVTKDADVFIRIANAVGSDPLGMPRSDADGGNAIELTGARFGSSTTGRGIALIRLNRP